MPQKDIRDRLRELAPTGEWMDMHLALRAAVGERSLALRCARQIPRRRLRAAGTRSGPSRLCRASLAGNELAGHVIIDTETRCSTGPISFRSRSICRVLKTSLYWRRDAAGAARGDVRSRAAHPAMRRCTARSPGVSRATAAPRVLTMADSIDNGNAASAAPLLSPRAARRPAPCSGSTAPSSRDTSRTAMRSSTVRCGSSRSATAADCS